MVDMCLPLLQITMSVEFPHHNDEKKNVWRPSNLGYDLWAYDCGGYIQLWRTTVIAMKQAKKMVQVDVRDRDKHWIQLLFIIGSSSPGAVFFSYWIWAQGQRLVEWG